MEEPLKGKCNRFAKIKIRNFGNWGKQRANKQGNIFFALMNALNFRGPPAHSESPSAYPSSSPPHLLPLLHPPPTSLDAEPQEFLSALPPVLHLSPPGLSPLIMLSSRFTLSPLTCKSCFCTSVFISYCCYNKLPQA